MGQRHYGVPDNTRYLRLINEYWAKRGVKANARSAERTVPVEKVYERIKRERPDGTVLDEWVVRTRKRPVMVRSVEIKSDLRGREPCHE